MINTALSSACELFSHLTCKEQKGRNEEIQKLKYLWHLHSISSETEPSGNMKNFGVLKVIQYNISLPVT